jgi:peptidoglycan/xylan/chitin deacetylase (PgdA/CDA1 family)
MMSRMADTAMASTYGFASRFAGLHRRTLRGAVRAGALSLLGGGYAFTGYRARMLQRPRVQILYLHHVFPDEEAGFRRLIERLAVDHTFLSFSDAVERIRSGPIDRPYVAITFDDGFKSCLRAAEMLESWGIRGCFFVCPAFLDVTDPQRAARICREILNLPPVEFMTWGEVERLRERGHEIGSHTMQHSRAAGLPPTRWQDEVEQSRKELERRVGAIDHFAWPYGRFEDVTWEAIEAVYDAGYTTCSSAVRGCHVDPHRGSSRDLSLRRDQIIAGWPLSHSLYFMAHAAARASAATNEWPANLRVW